MKKKRKIAVVTGSRAEYGLLYWLLQEIKNDIKLELQLIVTGAHLAPEFGATYRLIEEDGFKIAAKVDMLLATDSAVGVAKSVGLATIGFADTYANLMPEIVVVLGDRYEILAAAQAAMLLKIPVAHIHGGEITEGAVDESIRHAITKLAHLHFPVAAEYQQHILQMGEMPDRIFNFGAPGLDHMQRTKFLTRLQTEKLLNIKFKKLNFLVTYHPVTLQPDLGLTELKELLRALDGFPEANIIFTGSNADEGGRALFKLITAYAEKNKHRAHVFLSLGLRNYISVAKQCDAVIGNSSSALIEIPHIKIPSVNIGIRQQGRLIASSVINCVGNANSIKLAIQQALSPAFKESLKHMVSPYGQGDASHKIKETLKKIQLEDLVLKKFNFTK